ncbi:MAG: hypothetical protein EHM47_03370 [Ignavibacteriales bacterium]|nr:MAG: hypothetical protein EHM47_03370 [Ignavibacteriales bacterium]
MKNYTHILAIKVIVVFVFIFSITGNPQSKPNSIYFEALGNGGLYSVNYDRLFTESFGGRIGFSYLSEISLIFSSINDFLSVPITLNYFLGNGSHKFELGAGVVYASFSGGDFLGFETNSGSSNVAGTATIGYRYQKADGGFLFRAGFTPLFNNEGFFPFGGISFGFGF